MRRRAVLLVTGWLAAGLLATLIGTAVIDSLGAGLFGDAGADGALSPEEVQRRLDAEVVATASPGSAPTPEAAPPAPPPSGAAPVSRAVPTQGGTVYATCTGSTVRLDAYNAAEGFRVDDPAPGPDARASVTFKRTRGSGKLEIVVTVTCRDGAPEPSITTDD